MRKMVKVITWFLIVALAGCALIFDTNRENTPADMKSSEKDLFSCIRTIDGVMQGPEVEKAKATLERLAFQPGNNESLWYFISLVPESSRRQEAIRLYSEFITVRVNNFTKGDTTLLIRDTQIIPGPPIFGVGATITLNGSFTKEQMRYYDLYSWPTSQLTIQQGMKNLNVIEGEGVILNYDNGKAYIFGCDFLK